MSLILSGTDGLSDVDGSAATPALRGTDANTGMFFPAADTIAFAEGGVESMRLDSNGNLSIGATGLSTVRLLTKGVDTASNTYSFLARNSADTNILAITNAGNVGIGTSTPKGVFDVIGTGTSSSNNWVYITGGNVGAANPSASFTGGIATATNYSSGNSEVNLVWANTVGSGQYFSISKWTGSAVTEQMRISSTGNVGIGTNNPTSSLVVSGAVAGSPTVDGVHLGVAGGFACIELCGSSSSGSLIDFTKSGSDAPGRILYNNVSDFMSFGTNNAERMRITSGGDLLVGRTSDLGAAARVNIESASGEPDILSMRYFNAASGKYWRHVIDSNNGYLLVNNGGTGVTIADGGTSWSAVSDERLKTDLKPIENAVDKVNQLRSVTGRYKSDEEGISRSFLIAQDVQKVLPEAVSATKSIESNDETEYLALSYTEVIPLLVASIKELNAKLDAQAVEIAALKAK